MLSIWGHKIPINRVCDFIIVTVFAAVAAVVAACFLALIIDIINYFNHRKEHNS